MLRLSDLFYVVVFGVSDAALFFAKLRRSLFGRRPERPPRRVLVIHTEGIGNLVMATPLIVALRSAWPGAEIVLAAAPGRGTRSLLDGAGLVDRAVELPDADGPRALGAREFWAELAQPPFDLALLCFPFNRRWKLAFLGLLGRLGCDGAALCFGPSDFRNLSGWVRYYARVPARAHEVEINLAMAEALGIERPARPRPVVGVCDEDRAFAREVFERLSARCGPGAAGEVSAPVVGIHPGSLAGASYKRWEAEKHIELARRLHKTFNSCFVLFQGPDDADAVGEVERGLGAVPHTVVAGATLGRVAAVIERCDLLVNTDSALGHIAAAVGTPTVTIFGPGDPVRVRPWSEKAWVVRRDEPCSPCIRIWRPVRCRYGWRCIRDLSVEEVFEAASEALSEAVRSEGR